MSAGLTLSYPVSSPTASWSPDVMPGVGETGHDVLTGIAAATMSDGVTQYTYQVADKKYRYVLAWELLLGTSWAALETFLDTVLGDKFNYTDGPCGPVTNTRVVRVAPEGFRRNVRLRPGGRVSVTLVLVDAD